MADGQALRRMTGNGIGKVGVLAVGEPEGALRPAGLPGLRVPVGASPNYQGAIGVDGDDVHDVAVGEGAVGFARWQVVIVAPRHDDVPGASPGSIAELHGVGIVDEAEVDEVVTNAP
jgi:hypothetical protein